MSRTQDTVPVSTEVFDLLIDRAQRYRAFAENVISALSETFPDAAGVAMRQLEALKKELGDE